jgi:hypothetical protein
VILKDNANNGLETDLTDGVSSYTFNSTENNTDRFSLLFRAPGVSTGIDNTNKVNTQVFVNADNQIVIIAPEKSTFSIYNSLGQQIESGIINAKQETKNNILAVGMYVVSVNNQSTKVIIK